MKLLAPLALVVTLCFVTISSGGGKKDPKDPVPLDKWNFDLVEKSWGLKVKSLEYQASNSGSGGKFVVLIEFTKDLKEEELKKLTEAIPPNQNTTSKTMAFFYFDKDNVVIQKQSNFYATSEMTGVKGDRFRLAVEGVAGLPVKVELRVVK